MFEDQQRNDVRQRFVSCWEKHRQGVALEPLEKQIVDVIVEHPEYHPLLQNPEVLQMEFDINDQNPNPFLHMGMHLALREQVGTDRPGGIASVTRSLLLKYQDGHQVEHLMMDCLAQSLWEAQQNSTAPDEQAYLEKLRKL